MLVVSATCQTGQNGSLRKQLTDIGREVLGVIANLLMCEQRGCSVLCKATFL
jgi:hypothetical protein